jgi:hypothetical protein
VKCPQCAHPAAAEAPVRAGGKAARRRKAGRALAGAAAAGLSALAFGAFAVSRVRPPLAAGAVVARGCAFEPPPGFSERPAPPGVWTSLARWEDGVSSIDVLYAPPGLAERAASAAGAADTAASAFNGADAARVEAAQPVRVDGVDGLRLVVSAGRAIMRSAQAGAVRRGSQPAPQLESQPFRGELVLLPASGATLVIRGSSAEGAAPDLRRALDAFCSRFRILARPS